MCAAAEHSGQDPFRALKPITKERAGDLLTTSLKAAVALILILSISLVLYSVLRGSARPDFFLWSDTPDPALHLSRLNSDTSPTNVSHLAFGIGGSARTWANRGAYSDLWWKPNSTLGFVFLDEKPDESQTKFKIQHRLSSDRGAKSAVRIARVAADLFRAVGEGGMGGVRWLVMGDDDTVFFPENLALVLGRYDHRGMVYVGGNSESVEQDVMHAYDMAFGGGGFAISYPLAAELAAAMDGCLERYHNFYGSDQRVWACVGELGVVLTREPGFHQIDIRGDPFGLLSAHPLAPLVSLHHLDYVSPLFPNKTQLESLRALMNAYEVDPLRTLQQCFCYHRKYKWSVSVSWGYTVQIYPVLLIAKDLETPLQTFKTWRSWKDGPFTFNTRPVSPDPCQQPVIFYFDSVKEAGANESLTSYRKFVAKPVKKCNRDYARAVAIEKIVVSAPKMDPPEWNQRPRRHCCDIDGSIGRSMRIRIRRCRHSETITF